MSQRTLLLRTTAVAVAASLLTTTLVLIVAPAARPSYSVDPTTISTDMPVGPVPLVEQETAIVRAVDRGGPAVVSVIITKDLPVMERYIEQPPFDRFFSDPFFAPFRIPVPQERPNGTERREIGGGTAFFVSADGLLLTNKHVVSDDDADYTVILNDGRRLPATVVARHPGNDIALLRVEGSGFTSLSISEEEPRLGQTVIAIGNALAEFRNTVSVGVISGLSRSITAGNVRGGRVEQLDRIIQTDAAINQGNSGGPLLTLNGSVIGMNTAVASGAQNIGFAIPASDLRAAIESFTAHGRILQAYLGVRYVPVTPALQEGNTLDYDYGVVITRGETSADLAVIPGSPADKAGLLENDIILEADGQRLDAENSLAAIVRRKQPGDTLRLRIASKGEEREVTVTLEEMRQ
jgi:serine protease Do